MESDARIEALKQAKREFEEICSSSADCQGHTLKLVPLRNDCEKKGESYKCYRGLQFEIGTTLDTKSYFEQQKILLDEEIDLTESKLKQMQEIRERKKKLEGLKKRVESDSEEPEEYKPTTPDPTEGIGFMVGFDTGFISSAFAGESGSWTLGAYLGRPLTRYFGVDAGINLNLWLEDPYSKQKTGIDYHISAPIYLKHYNSKSVIFIAPEFRSLSHGSGSRTGIGAAIGWQDFVRESDTGWGLRAGITKTFDAGAYSPTLFLISISVLLGI